MAGLGLLGSKDLGAGVDELICTLDEPCIFNVTVCNRTTNTPKIRIAIGTGASPALKDYIQYDMPLDANLAIERTGRSRLTGEKVWVRSDIAGVSACVESVPST